MGGNGLLRVRGAPGAAAAVPRPGLFSVRGRFWGLFCVFCNAEFCLNPGAFNGEGPGRAGGGAWRRHVSGGVTCRRRHASAAPARCGRCWRDLAGAMRALRLLLLLALAAAGGGSAELGGQPAKRLRMAYATGPLLKFQIW